MRNLSIKVSAVPFFPYDPNSFLSIGSNPGSWSCYWAVTRWDLCCGLFWGTGLNFDGYWFGVGLAPLSGCKRTGLNWFIWGICTQALGCPMGRFLEQFLRVLKGKIGWIWYQDRGRTWAVSGIIQLGIWGAEMVLRLGYNRGGKFSVLHQWGLIEASSECRGSARFRWNRGLELGCLVWSSSGWFLLKIWQFWMLKVCHKKEKKKRKGEKGRWRRCQY